jgi:uncharacterized membrane protein YvlD (DUF360 family)
MTAARPILRVAGVAMRGLVLWALVALVFWVVVGLILGFDLPSFGAALLTTGLIALFNALLWPLLIRIVLPLTVITFGLGSLVLNAAVVAPARGNGSARRSLLSAVRGSRALSAR